MRSLSVWIPLALALAAAGVPAADGAHRLKERVPAPRGWTKAAPAPADHILELRIALPQPNFAELERHLYEVSCVRACGAGRGCGTAR